MGVGGVSVVVGGRWSVVGGKAPPVILTCASDEGSLSA